MQIDREAIIKVFRAECAEALTLVEGNLVKLERDPESRELVQEVFRAVHTLKGDALSLGFAWLSEFAHALEDVLDALREQALAVTSPVINLLLCAVDALRIIVPESLDGKEERHEQHRALLLELERLPKAPAAGAVQRAEQGSTPQGREAAGPLLGRAQTLRVEIDKLDRMLTLSGELAISRGRTRQVLEERRDALPKELWELHLEADRLLLDLQEIVLRARMVPVLPIFSQYARTVRDTASTVNKLARLRVRADGVELDTAVVERIRAPLAHMMRNAVDHGIETPEVRSALGKDPCGTVALDARQDGSSIVIEVTDDGAGLDREKIVERARVLGLNPEALPEREQLELIFESGFSTAASVTEVSGRGLGMDIVRRSIDSLRGRVSIESRRGVGTTFRIRLPLTLAMIEGLVVGVEEERYVIPLSSVIECVDFEAESRGGTEARGLARVRDETLPFLRLRKLFNISEREPPRENLVVVRHGAGKLGLTVDALLGDAQTMIKPLGRLFRDVPGVAGSAILGNGRVALILDVPGLLQSGAEAGLAAS